MARIKRMNLKRKEREKKQRCKMKIITSQGRQEREWYALLNGAKKWEKEKRKRKKRIVQNIFIGGQWGHQWKPQEELF